MRPPSSAAALRAGCERLPACRKSANRHGRQYRDRAGRPRSCIAALALSLPGFWRRQQRCPRAESRAGSMKPVCDQSGRSSIIRSVRSLAQRRKPFSRRHRPLARLRWPAGMITGTQKTVARSSASFDPDACIVDRGVQWMPLRVVGDMASLKADVMLKLARPGCSPRCY